MATDGRCSRNGKEPAWPPALRLLMSMRRIETTGGSSVQAAGWLRTDTSVLTHLDNGFGGRPVLRPRDLGAVGRAESYDATSQGPIANPEASS
jgi:hypothetical protein